MAFLPILTAIGGLVSGVGTIAAGEAQKNALDFKAKQEDMAANEARAVAGRKEIETRRQGALVQSQLQARAGASGAGAADPTVMQLGGGIAGRTEYDALYTMASGENRARGLEDTAMGDRMSGDAAATGGMLGGIGKVASGIGMGLSGESKMTKFGDVGLSGGNTILGGASSAFSKYWPDDDMLFSRGAYGAYG